MRYQTKGVAELLKRYKKISIFVYFDELIYGQKYRAFH